MSEQSAHSAHSEPSEHSARSEHDADGEPGGAHRAFSEQSPIRVLLLDDHEVVRRGLYDLLDAEADIDVVGEAATASQALARGPALRPDVAVLDVRLPDGDGITVCRELRSGMPQLACLMLTSFDDDEALLDAIMAGASGYVLKQIKGSDLVSAVRTVAAGQSMLDPATTARLMGSVRGTAGGAGEDRGGHEDAAVADLSPRERDILELIGEGLTNRQIGRRLFLSEKTVKNHISRLLAKLGVERRVQAAVLATRSHPQDHAGPHGHHDDGRHRTGEQQGRGHRG